MPVCILIYTCKYVYQINVCMCTHIYCIGKKPTDFSMGVHGCMHIHANSICIFYVQVLLYTLYVNGLSCVYVSVWLLIYYFLFIQIKVQY